MLSSRGYCRVTTRVFWVDLDPYFGHGDRGANPRHRFRIAGHSPVVDPWLSSIAQYAYLGDAELASGAPRKHTVHHATLLQHVNSSPGPDPRRNGPCPSCPGRESVADVLSKSCSCWQIITRRRSISHLRQPAPPSSSYFFCSTLTILSGFTRSRRFLLGGPISCSPDPLFRCGAPLLARPVLARLTSQEAQHRKQPRNARPSSSPTSRALRFSWRERDNKTPMEQDPDSTIIHKNAD